MIGLGALGAAIGIGIMGGKFLEGPPRASRSWSRCCRAKMFLLVGLIDAVPIIGVAIAMLLRVRQPAARPRSAG